jgi:hypothetical protein
MNNSYWARLLPWRQKNAVGSNPNQINFEPQLVITREDTRTYLVLQLVNRSSSTVWVEEASVALADLDADRQTEVPTGRATNQILQNVRPKETFSVSLARAIYDAADRPQGPYSCLTLTNVRYRVFNESRNAQLETCRVEMAALTVVDLHRARSYDRKMKRIRGPVVLTTYDRKG